MSHRIKYLSILAVLFGCTSNTSSGTDANDRPDVEIVLRVDAQNTDPSVTADVEVRDATLELDADMSDLGTNMPDAALSDQGTNLPDAGLMTMAKPNIVLIVVDDMGYGDVGFHGSEIETPVIDGLVRGGIELQRFYTFPVCGPTRKGLLTGRSPVTMGSIQNPRPNDLHSLPLDEHLISETLSAHDYQNWIVGKWHLGGATNDALLPGQRGFDHFYGHVGAYIDSYTHRAVNGGGLDWQRNGEPIEEMGYSTDLLTDEAIELVQARDADRPFFLYLAYNAVHTPLAAPEDLVEKYSFIDRDTRRTYAAMLDAVDGNIGRLMSTLESESIRDNTLVFFMSDNGGNENMGGASNDPFRGVKGQVYEGGIRVAAGINWPGVIQPGGLSSDFVSILDVFPTLAAAAGIAPQNTLPLDGRNLWEDIQDDEQSTFDEYIVTGNHAVTLFQDQWKLLRFYNGDGPQLFDIISDPSEESNLGASELLRVDAMLDILAERTAHIADELN